MGETSKHVSPTELKLFLVSNFFDFYFWCFERSVWRVYKTYALPLRDSLVGGAAEHRFTSMAISGFESMSLFAVVAFQIRSRRL